MEKAKSVYEKEYQQGKKIEKTNAADAKEFYEKAKWLGKLAIARLYLEKKISPNQEEVTQIQIYDTALEILDKTKFTDVPDKFKNHEEFRKIKNELLKIIKITDIPERILGKAYFILTNISLTGNDNDKFINTVLAGWYLEAQAIVALKKKLNIKNPLTETIRKALLFIIDQQAQEHEYKYEKLYILYLLANFIVISQPNKTDLVKSNVFNQVSSDEINKINSFNLEFLPELLINFSKKMIGNPYTIESTTEAINTLLEKNAINDNLTEATNYLLGLVLDEAYLKENQFLVLLYCKIAEIQFQKEQYELAIKLFEIGLKYLDKNNQNFDSLFALYNELLQKTGTFNNIFSVDNAESIEIYKEAKRKFEQGKSEKNLLLIIDAINFYLKAAVRNNIDAAKELFSLYAKQKELIEKVPEITAALSELLRKLSPAVLQKISGAIPKNKKIIAYAEELTKEARDAYETLLKNHTKDGGNIRSDIYRVVANLRYEGRIFEQNLHLARLLYQKAIEIEDPAAYYQYAHMCFYGEGGDIDFNEAKKYLFHQNCINSDSIAARRLKAEFTYFDYLQAADSNNIDSKAEYLTKCLELYRDNVIVAGDEFSLFSIFIIFYYDKELEAAKILADLYQNYFSKVQLLAKALLPDVNVEPEKYHLYFLDYINKYSNISNQEITGQGFEEPAYIYAKQRLEENDPLPMTKFADTNYQMSAIQLLTQYYKEKNNGELNLLTTLCYMINRHITIKTTRIREHAKCKLLVEVLENLNPTYKKFEKADFTRELERRETQTGQYYDEYESGDSDLETEDTYQAQDKHITADYPRIEELAAKIQPVAKKEIKKLLESKTIDEKKYTDQVDKIKNLFLEAIDVSLNLKHDKLVREDLCTVNHFAARGELAEGLRLVSTKFVLAQTRGIHFKVTSWSQQQRRKFWQYIKDKDHVFHNKPVFSAAVYARAGIDDYTEVSPLAYLRLEKVARYMHQRLMLLRTEQPYKKDDVIVMPDSIYRYSFKNRNAQIQQLYSNQYDLFHDFLNSEVKTENSIFIVNKNPLVSTADIQSSHSERYAYGSKPYAGHEHERLRPKYNADGRAIRPHSGAVFLTLHPLSDYARSDNNHIVSMCMTNQIVVDQRIIPERECSFYSFIEKNRLIFIHKAKYPSFHHNDYPKVFLHLYGIDMELYKLFKELITDTKPHEPKRRLAVLLLGEYLAAYQTLYLMRYAHDKANKQKLVLLYRDKYGNYSLKPTFDISPTPAGDEDKNRLRRTYTAFNRTSIFSLTNSNSAPLIQQVEDAMDIDSDNQDKINQFINNDDNSDEELAPPQAKRRKITPEVRVENNTNITTNNLRL